MSTARREKRYQGDPDLKRLTRAAVRMAAACARSSGPANDRAFLQADEDLRAAAIAYDASLTPNVRARLAE